MHLNSGHPLDQCIVLYGPRGNGKTSLLYVVEHRRATFCDESKQATNVKIVVVRPEDVNKASMHELLTGEPEPIKVTHREKVHGSLQVMKGEMQRSKRFERSTERYSQAFLFATRKQPVLLCIDEAHLLERDLLNDLILGFQTAAVSNAPIGLVLSGTPQLRGHLSSIDASLVTGSEFIRLGRLDEGSATLAMRKPLE